MNTAQKIILSIVIPVLVIFPFSMIELKMNFQDLGASSCSTYHSIMVYQVPWFWYFAIIVTGIFLFILWKPNRVKQLDQKEI